MNDARQPIVPGSQPLSTPPPPPTKADPDEKDFAAFLEEEHTTVPPPAPAVAKSPSGPPPPPHIPPKPIIHFGPEGQRKQHTWKRQTGINGTGSCRVKSFRGKYTDQGLEHLDDTINEWLDTHPEVEVKFVTSTTASFEGKVHDPVLVLNLWY